MNYMQQQQQNPFEFLKWVPVSGEKYLGIAVIRFERRFIFRFKILPSESGGLWATTASLKTGIFNGKDKYDAAFEMDSNFEKESMLQFVVENVHDLMNRKIATTSSPFPLNSPSISNPVIFNPQSINSSQSYTQPSFDSQEHGCPF